MRSLFSKPQPEKNPLFPTLQWALEKIREVKEQGLDILDLSVSDDPDDRHKRLYEFPVEILELSGLRVLNLEGNRVLPVPEGIVQLQSLRTLNLRFNDLRIFPESILGLLNLTSLDLSGNRLYIVPESIGQLQNLTSLNLSTNRLNAVPESIGQLQNLTSLDLSGNGLGTLPESITQLQKLRELDLSSNLLDAFPEPITRLQNLTSLHLYAKGIDLSPETIAQLQKLTSLDLSGSALSTFPEWISQLLNLTSLNLRANELVTIPGSITRLQNLTSLDLSNNQLGRVPRSITELQNLTSLNLSSNGIDKISEFVAQLQKLRDLDLSYNKLNRVSESISQLQNLRTLNLSHNQLNTTPASTSQLQGLVRLFWGSNRLQTIPESISQLKNLTSLDLSYNQLSEIPESISQLQELTSLNLRDNELSTFPESIIQLSNLKTLDLSRNLIETIPESIAQLQGITSLNLSDNELATLPKSITRLQNLTSLDLSDNGLSTIPLSITKLVKLTNLALSDNPLSSPPIEIAVQGIKSIEEYFRQLRQAGEDYLYEAKLLILGEGGAGKTTFAHKLLDSDYALKEEGSTKGVDVFKWSFLIEGNKQFKVNIWDFGGQEIYHATHQFFLTGRSLYTLIADTRKDDTDFYYWLNVAELLSDSSPLLIIKNEKEDRPREIDERQLRGQFGSLKGVLATNLATNRGLEAVKDEIKHYLQKLPHIGAPLPKTWVRVREQLEKDWRNHISLEEYLALCEENGFTELKDSLQLSGYLHDIGVFLHFQDDLLLKKTVILKPKWGTDAVYKVLDNQMVIRNLGRFTSADLETIWAASEYENMHEELLQLMMKFKLCYEIPTQKGAFIAPQLLSENQPEYEWDEKENLLLRYSYEFMPKGILTQFIVVMHPYIWEQRIVWKRGLVIEKDRTRAEVIEHYGKIHVRVAGEQRRELMAVIRHELEQIHDTYKRLKYDELIQCNCPACKDNPEPYFYSLAELIDFRANGQTEIQCRKKPYNMVNVMGLLGDVIDISQPSERATFASILVQGDYIQNMTNIKQVIRNSTIYGSVVAAESIKDSFNTIQNSNANEDLKDTLTQLTQAVEAMAKELPKAKAEEAADDMKRLVEEATKEKPSARWYSVSIDGLIAAAQNLGKVGDEVIKLTEKVRKILTGGLL